MAYDAALLAALDQEEEPILHLYEWEGEAATYGYFLDPDRFLSMEAVRRRGLQLARRPTGGGIIFHLCDLAFSVLMPATHPCCFSRPLENYAFINERVLEAIKRVVDLPGALLEEEEAPLDAHCKNFCMATPTKYDVMVQGKKVGGAAQRRTRAGYLHQGSIAIGVLPEGYLRELLVPETHVLDAMRATSFTLLGEGWSAAELEEVRASLRNQLTQLFS